LPVIDSSAITQLVLQLQEAKRQLEVLQGQYAALQQQLRAMTGTGEIGNLLQGAERLTRYPWMSLTQEQLIDMMRQGLLPGNIEHRRQYLANITPTLPPEAITPHNPSSSRAQFYTHHAETTLAGQAALSGQQQALIELRKSTIALEQVINEQEDVKRAVDLNNAMVGNLTEILIESVRAGNVTAEQVALINQVIVDSSNSDARFFGAARADPAVASVVE